MVLGGFVELLSSCTVLCYFKVYEFPFNFEAVVKVLKCEDSLRV